MDSARLIKPGAYMDLLRHAWLRYAAGDYRGTIAFAQRAYLLRRDSVDAIMVLTQAAQRINNVRDADAAYRLALSDHPSDESLRRSYVDDADGDRGHSGGKGSEAQNRPSTFGVREHTSSTSSAHRQWPSGFARLPSNA